MREHDEQFPIDTILGRRGLRDHTMGCTGKRVFCDRLDNVIGLQGRFCYLHDREDGQAIEDPVVVEISVNGRPVTIKRAAVYWHPSHVYRRTTEHDLRIQEHKFITADDVLCDQIELTNEGDMEVTVEIDTSCGALSDAARVGRDGIAGGWHTYGQPVRMVLAAPARPNSNNRTLETRVSLKPGQTESLLVALAVSDTQLGAQEALRRWSRQTDPLQQHREEYQQWFDDNCPDFECSDAFIQKIWWYRWFVARHNLIDPGAGYLRYPAFYEGKHGGYARMITASAPLILNEVRWLRDQQYSRGMIRNLLQTQPEEGLYRDLWVDRRRGLQENEHGNPDPGYEEFLPAAFWGALLVHPSRGFTEQVAASMARNIEGLRKIRDKNGNLLLNPGGHHMTQEHAPSFTYFHDFDDWYDYTELERPDYSAFFYGSLCAAAAAFRSIGEAKKAEWYDNLAERCADAICTHLWNDDDGYFYAIREADGEYAFVREANGLFPFAFMAVPDEPEYARALEYLFDEDELFSPWPFATCSRQCPAASLTPGYWGEEKKSSYATWNGPTWPYANSILTEAIANVIRYHSQEFVDGRLLTGFLSGFARMMCEDQDLNQPMVREVYDGETGEGYGCPDYFHSSFNDLVIRFMCGVIPLDEDTLVVDPLCEGWTHFRLENLRYRGNDIDIIYETRSADEAYSDVPSGLTVRVNGEMAAHEEKLETIAVDLPTSTPVAEEDNADMEDTKPSEDSNQPETDEPPDNVEEDTPDNSD